MVIPPILILIPAFNEAENILPVLRMLEKGAEYYDILVINDASDDDTGELARSTGTTRVIDLPFNLGVGGAIQTGFKYAVENKYAIVLQFDADGQHQVQEIRKLVEPILNDETDVAIGSRFLTRNNGYRSTLSRRFGIQIFQWVSSLLIGKRITDCTSGFRAYNRKAIEFLADHYPGDYPEPEAVILLGKNHFRIMEVSISMLKRQGGKSSITIFNSPYYMTKVTLAMIMTAVRSRIVVKKP